jgi:geranylgeranyl diphosphate synthase, type I
MSRPDPGLLRQAVAERRQSIERHLDAHPPSGLQSQPLLDGVHEYLRRGGKCLRGSVCLLSCGLFGGPEQDALPAAAAIEVFHAWTLVHDDIVDRDTVRRGGPTLHRWFERAARSGHEAPWYGLSLSLLCGDIQQAWSAALLSDLAPSVPAVVALACLREMCGRAVPQLIEGEVLDIELSGMRFGEVTREAILEMIDKKTAVLFRFAGRSGAWIGLRSAVPRTAVETLEAFLTDIGVAFQLKDDVLGVTSSADKTGKDSDSDIREGKRTLIAALAYERASEAGRGLMDRTLGHVAASTEDVRSVRDLFLDTKAVAEVEASAEDLVSRALGRLRELPDRPQRQLLEQLALYLVHRDR